MSSYNSLESSLETHTSSTRHTTIDSFKSPPLQLQNPRTQDVFQSIVKGRKSWKTLRGGEIVWPPELEAALIEGLENYQPDDSRETRLLGRFPMRNRFISDWIYEKTGKRRTAKQVGSRLQQLRDTCGGKRLLNLLSPNRRPCRTPSLSPEYQHKDGHMAFPPPLRYDSESCSDSSASAPPTPTEAHATLQNLLYRGVEPRVEDTPDTIVYIDLLPEGSQADDQFISWSSSSMQGAEERSLFERGYKVIRASQQPRHLRDIDPTVTLLSKLATAARSNFTVYAESGGSIFAETTTLEPVDPSLAPTSDGSLLYKTSLVPGYWDEIVQSNDASQFFIIQKVVQDSPSATSSSTIFSAMYKFNYVSPSTHQDHTFQSSINNILPIDSSMQNHHKVDFPYEPMLTVTSDDTFNLVDMMGFNPKTPQPYFDINSYWSASPPDSVYSSPNDCNRQLSGVVNGNEHLLSQTSYPMEDVPNYAI